MKIKEESGKEKKLLRDICTAFLVGLASAVALIGFIVLTGSVIVRLLTLW
jgi:hypothetical protein